MNAEWLKKFWGNHGERITFMVLATIFAAAFLFIPDLEAEGKTILVMIAGILVNKVRGPMNGAPEERKDE
jgi:hypothetical protein